jgi:hypothetical protein
MADLERRRHPLIRKMQRHTYGGMVEIVAVVHPNAGIISTKRYFVSFACIHVEGIRPPWASGDRLAVPAEQEHVMAVQVHRVRNQTSVHEDTRRRTGRKKNRFVRHDERYIIASTRGHFQPDVLEIRRSVKIRSVNGRHLELHTGQEKVLRPVSGVKQTESNW